jgi:RHS repeat-associated protein
VLHQVGTNVLDGASYTYDPAGNRTGKTNYLNGVTSNYTYDPLYQLTQVTQGGNTTESYSYDAVGNRLSSPNLASYQYNASNELTASSFGSYQYDANGNSIVDAQGRTFNWDFENRLIEATNPGIGTTAFKYDPFGRRIQKSGPLGTINYFYDGANALEEVDNSGNILARYTSPFVVDQPLADLRGTANSYYQLDGLGSVTSLADAAGIVGRTNVYDSFGNLTTSTGAPSGPFQYAARDFDVETGLHYYRARYYDSQVGRFISEDPFQFYAGWNFYTYVFNNPGIYTDPTGNEGVIDSILNWVSPVPSPASTPAPAGPGVLYTNMNNGNLGGSTTFYPGGNSQPLTIPTFTHPDNRSRPGAGAPYCSIVVGVIYAGNRPAYGLNGADINTGDLRQRNIHGGGSHLPNPFTPYQPLRPTRGCTRGHNTDVINLGRAITAFQEANPGTPIIYCRGE